VAQAAEARKSEDERSEMMAVEKVIDPPVDIGADRDPVELVMGSMSYYELDEPEPMLTVAQAARMAGVSATTIRRICEHEPGVRRIVVPGRKKPIVRIPLAVAERIIRRATVT
jgi:hypothetical protein